MGVIRIGHISLRVTNLEAARAHYQDVVGLYETHRDRDGTTYYKCWDEWDKYSLILTPGKTPGANYIAFKVEHDSDLDVLGRRIRDYGLAAEMLTPGAIPFAGRALSFVLPNGTRMMLFAQKEAVGKNVAAVNPDPWPDDRHGCGVMHLDHCLLVAELDPLRGVNKVAESADFLIQALDFQLTERFMGGARHELGMAFLTRSSKPHDLALVGGPRAGLHHIGFYLDSWDHVLNAADVMAKHRTRVDFGPTRHGITRGATIYFFDPSGNRNETFAGLGYWVTRDMPVVDWTEEQVGRGIFYHAGVITETFRSEYTAAS
jgi:catechol 2,3-dioxygenase